MDVARPFPPGWPPGWHVEHVAETGSTSADLLAVAGTAPTRTVRFTDHQTAGRGRLDRRWDAPPGANLLVSFLFRGGTPIEWMRRIGVAAVAAAADVAGVTARLKWPNDVLVDGRKLAGMLAQLDGSHAEPVTVVGLGLNVGWAPDGAARLGDHLVPADVLAAELRAFDAFDGDLHARYSGLLATLGQEVRVELPDGATLVGRATAVEPDGRLVLLDACALTHRIDAGDVIHLRPI